MAGNFLLYGSNGYVGHAIAELAVDLGLRPVLAGRNAATIGPLAEELALDHRVASLDDNTALDAALADIAVVLNCAGPFVYTFEPLVEACLRTGTHYLDITGEPPVYESIAARSERAKSLGVMLLPGAGFDVVATDCLAAHLAARLPTATHLTLAFHQQGPAAAPPGTLRTLVEMMAFGSSKQHRVDGRVVKASGRRKTRSIDFGQGPVKASMMTWGDIFQAYHSTGIPNIEDYIVIPPDIARQTDLSERIRPLFRFRVVRSLAKKTLHGGATAKERAQTKVAVWGEVTDTSGRKAVSRLHGPDAGLVWTSRAAMTIVKRVLGGDAVPGHQTPSSAYGPDLVLEADGVTREDVA